MVSHDNACKCFIFSSALVWLASWLVRSLYHVRLVQRSQVRLCASLYVVLSRYSVRLSLTPLCGVCMVSGLLVCRCCLTRFNHKACQEGLQALFYDFMTICEICTRIRSFYCAFCHVLSFGVLCGLCHVVTRGIIYTCNAL